MSGTLTMRESAPLTLEPEKQRRFPTIDFELKLFGKHRGGGRRHIAQPNDAVHLKNRIKRALAAYFSPHTTGKKFAVHAPKNGNRPANEIIKVEGPIGMTELINMIGAEEIKEGSGLLIVSVSRSTERTAISVGRQHNPVFQITGKCQEIEELAAWLGEVGIEHGGLPRRNAEQLQFEYVLNGSAH